MTGKKEGMTKVAKTSTSCPLTIFIDSKCLYISVKRTGSDGGAVIMKGKSKVEEK